MLLQRQVEVGALLEGYFQVLLNVDSSDCSTSLQLEMLSEYCVNR